MAVVELFVTGDQIGTYSSWSMSGNNNGVKLTLNDVQTLGGPEDVFRIVVRQVNNGQDEFSNGQFVDIYSWPDTDPPSEPLFSGLNPQHDQFQGRASSSEHQVFTSPENIVLDVNGLTDGTVQYGPGIQPYRWDQLPFDAFPTEPPWLACFVKGTLIETATGPLPIEVLRPGDLIRTQDNGLQPLRYLAGTTVAGQGSFAPVTFDAGALGNYRALSVSPQHRMLLSDWRAEMWFGEAQVLVGAKHLVNGSTIRVAPCASVTYCHMVFDRHEIVLAEGIPSESLHLGSVALTSLDAAARAELCALFPDLAADLSRGRPAGQRETARTCLRGWEGRLIAPAATAA